MKLDELIAKFRSEADDATAPYLWSDEEVTAWLDEAEQEAAIRAGLLPEKTDPAICQIAVTAGTANYTLHAAVVDIRHARLVAAGVTHRPRLSVVSPEAMDRLNPYWRDLEAGIPTMLVQDEQALTLVPPPADDATLHMEVRRIPVDSIETRGEPEIAAAHHRHLVNWVLFKAYSKPDAETIDPQRAAKAEKLFEGHFGLRRDAQLGRDYSADQPHHNIAIW